jgi:hypothetical protein
MNILREEGSSRRRSTGLSLWPREIRGPCCHQLYGIAGSFTGPLFRRKVGRRAKTPPTIHALGQIRP